jgi:hypothetical protein
VKPKKLLLATAALSSSLACGGKSRTDPIFYSNPKGSRYDQVDAGVEDAAPEPTPDAGTEPQAP